MSALALSDFFLGLGGVQEGSPRPQAWVGKPKTGSAARKGRQKERGQRAVALWGLNGNRSAPVLFVVAPHVPSVIRTFVVLVYLACTRPNIEEMDDELRAGLIHKEARLGCNLAVAHALRHLHQVGRERA